MSALITFATHMLILGMPGALFFATSHLFFRRRRILLSSLCGIAIAFLAYVGCLSWPDAEVISIHIDNLKDKDAIKGAWPKVEGTVRPADARVYLLVHPD